MKVLLILGLIASGCVGQPTEVEDGVATSGDVDLEWAIFRGESIVSCIDAGASELRLTLHGLDRDAEQVATLGCYAGIGAVERIEPGEYDVSLQLVAPAGTVIVAAEVHDVVVAPGRTTPLGAIEFTLVAD